MRGFNLEAIGLFRKRERELERDRHTVTSANMADARDQLQPALEANDPPAVAKAAHRLAGVAAFADSPEMTPYACHIEDAALGGDLAAASKRFETLPSL